MKTIELQTSHGVIRAELDDEKAPKTVANFLAYVQAGHYDGTVFHSRAARRRAAIPPAPARAATLTSRTARRNARPSRTSAVSARWRAPRTRTAPTASSSSCFDDATFLDNQYTVWGEVVEGMEHVDNLPKGEPPREPGSIVKATLS